MSDRTDEKGSPGPPIEHVQLRPVSHAEPRPQVDSPFDDYGVPDPRSAIGGIERWVIQARVDGTLVDVGDMTAKPVWYGPTTGSMAMSIGIGIVTAYRGRGIGTRAQILLTRELHERGVIRVEASTDVLNVVEQRALAKAGFAYEGTARSAQERRDGRHDLQVWSHLGDGAESSNDA